MNRLNLAFFVRSMIQPKEHRCVFTADADNPPTPYGSQMMIFGCEHEGCRRTMIISTGGAR